MIPKISHRCLNNLLKYRGAYSWGKRSQGVLLTSITLIELLFFLVAFPADVSAFNILKLDNGTSQMQLRQGQGVGQGAGQKEQIKLQLGLDSLLREFRDYQQAVANRQAVPGTFASKQTLANIANERVLIDAVASNDPEDLVSVIEGLGGEVFGIAGKIVSARIPVEMLSVLDAGPELKFARPAVANTHTGSVTSQGDKAQYSDLGRSTFGVNGSGQKVGVLSDSFNCLGGYGADQASGDLPNNVLVLADIGIGCSDEGRAMTQIVFDVAPGAGLAFHTAFNGEADFAQGILDLTGAGATVIVDDVIYFTEPMFQDGVIAQAVDAVHAQGVSYFSSAGNYARQSYEAPFRPSGQYINIGYGLEELHDFDPGSGIQPWQQVTISGKATFILQWDQPFYSVSGGSGSASDIDFCVSTTRSASGLVGCSIYPNVGVDPLEIIELTGSGTVYIAIPHYAGPFPNNIKFVWSGNASGLEFATDSPTAYGHANAAGANAVGASAYFLAPEFGRDPPVLNYFSSAGGIPILFDTSGVPVNQQRLKPEFTAPDGGNNTFFGIDYEGDGKRNFFGTSAAAPHAAGVAALMLDATPKLTPQWITKLMKQMAIDIVAQGVGGFGGATRSIGAGFDADSGAGLIDAYYSLAGGSCDQDAKTLNQVLTGFQVHTACLTLNTGPAAKVKTGAEVSLYAGQKIIFNPGFTVEQGALLSAAINPALVP